MKVKQLFKRRKPSAERLYAAIVASARQPALYGKEGAPDTVEGRLTMIILNLALAIERLKQLNMRGQAQQLVETFFVDVEGNMRESGVSDVAIPKRIRVAEAIYVNTMSKLEGSTDRSHAEMRAAVETCFSGLQDCGSLRAVGDHASRTRSHLASLGSEQILNGEGWL